MRMPLVKAMNCSHRVLQFNLLLLAIVSSAMPSAACSAADAPLPDAQKYENNRLEDRFRRSKDHFVCAGIGFIPQPRNTQDAESHFFDDETRQHIVTCGYWVQVEMSNKKQDYKAVCPPPAWRANGCDAKYREWSRDKNR